MSVLARRITAIEKAVGGGSDAPAMIDRWWSCYARIGHENEDIAEAARLAGVVVGEGDGLIVGIMTPGAPNHWPIPPMQPLNDRGHA